MDPQAWGRWWRLVGKPEVVRILGSDWDPIGLGELLPDDEYECVADHLATPLRENAPPSQIAALLGAQARDHFGLHDDISADAAAAALLVAWYATAFDEPSTE